jgi:hypothetical protein
MVQISPTGVRNEYWRRRLLLGLMVPERYAAVMVPPEIEKHPGLVDALAYLLTCQPQMDPVLNQDGDCDWLQCTVAGITFNLFVSCFAQGEVMERGSDDFADDEVTTRIFSCVLAHT